MVSAFFWTCISKKKKKKERKKRKNANAILHSCVTDSSIHLLSFHGDNQIVFIINYIDKIMMLSQSEDLSKTKLEVFSEHLVTELGWLTQLKYGAQNK